MHRTNIDLPTKYASAFRYDDKQIAEHRKILLDIPYIKELIDSVPDIFCILNSARQLVLANRAFYHFVGDTSELNTGKRLGETMACEYWDKEVGGCGTTEFCKTCGNVQATLSAINGTKSTSECEITNIHSQHTYEFSITATPFTVGDHTFTINYLKDISELKRKIALERIFFHDIMNTAGGLKGFAEILVNSKPEDYYSFADIIKKLSDRLIDEIAAQKDLIDAEHDELAVRPTATSSKKVLEKVKEIYLKYQIRNNKQIIINPLSENIFMQSDETLLIRVLGNLLKNALEAIDKGDTVDLSCFSKDQGVVFAVKNSGYIPHDHQLQLFKRSFSTKGTGRGLGTYSIKLLTEKYLEGKVWFESSVEKGTAFFAWYPLQITSNKF